MIESLVYGAVLTIGVVYAFLNSWRSTLITATSLPTSVLAAFIAVWLCGFTLNFMTLLGLSLAIGVLIDDAIVVRENIVRHVQLGADHRKAALDGTREIALAVLAAMVLLIWPSAEDETHDDDSRADTAPLRVTSTSLPKWCSFCT